MNNGYTNAEFKIMERVKLSLCKFCDSGNIRKDGKRKTKQGKVQRFKCFNCKKRFTANFGFERKYFDSKIITEAIQMYYRGMSFRDIADNFEMFGTDVGRVTVFYWVSKYSKLVSEYIETIVPRTQNRIMVRADKIWIKIAGEQKYLFASMDDDSRYWLASDMAHSKFQHNADTLLALTKDHLGGRTPAYFVTDGLPAYMKSSRKVFGNKTHHNRHIHLAGDMHNNKMERLNGEIRDREKVFRGLKKFDTPLIDGLKVYYNYAKKHSALGGKTPAQKSLIKVEGKNIWFTLIQNANLYHIHE